MITFIIYYNILYMSEIEIELKKSVDIIINNIKTSKIILMNDFDKIVDEYRKFHLKNRQYNMIDVPFKYGGKYKYTNIDISNIVGDYINIKIEDFYNPIKLPKYGNISTSCHLNMFHFTNPIIPYTNINYDWNDEVFRVTIMKQNEDKSCNIIFLKEGEYIKEYNSYEEAELACLIKLIEIVKEKL